MPDLEAGHWTNITLHSLNKLDSNLCALAKAHDVSFYGSSASQEGLFASGLPMRLGSRKVIKRMGEFKQEGSLVSVKLYNHATYMTLFDNKLLNGSEEAKRSDINH